MFARAGSPFETRYGPQAVDSFELAFAGVARQAELLRAREVSARELTELYLARIAELDPRINAFRVVFGDQAIAEAARVQERLDGGEEAPLLGVPVAVKDNVDVAYELTTHGTAAVTKPAPADSEIVRRLRSAGAVILGKTTLPELAMWGHITETDAWGVTRNPWNLERSPGGSSGGSAAAVAAGLVPAALGSDGGASIRVPAALCGVFGLKPQRGRVSMMPATDHWYGLTVFGGLARTVLDAALFDDAIRGPAVGDRYVAPTPESSFAEAARREPPGLRVAVSTKPTLPVRPSAEAHRAVESTAELLRELGHQIREADPPYGQLFPDIMPRYMAGVHRDATQLEHPERLERRTRAFVRVGARLRGRAVARALRREHKVADRVGAVFRDHDVLLTPVTARPAPKADRWRGKGAFATFDGGRPYVCYTAIWNYTGQPAAAVPAGFDGGGLPQAVQLVGRPNAETTLLSLAAQLEAARPWSDRRPPLTERAFANRVQ
jgi:amidase